MIALLTPNTQAILLLTAPLIVGRSDTSRDLLSLGEYNRLARILREKQKQPASLIGPEAKEVIELCAEAFGRKRLEALLGRGFLLSQAIERWNARAIWVLSRADGAYPKKIKARLKEDAPPVLYGCGEIGLLESGGLAVVGSRQVDDQLLEQTVSIGRLVANSGRPVISGGAKGIDRAAMEGGLQVGGVVIGVMADSLERAALAHDNRESLMSGRLVLISPYDPSAGFNVGHAMQRNKIIYALADAALVVTSDFHKGGTWAGAIEQLERLHYVPLFVRNGANAGKGNLALLQRGAHLWPEPGSVAELQQAIADAAASVAAQPKQDTFALPLREEAAPYETPTVVVPAEQQLDDSAAAKFPVVPKAATDQSSAVAAQPVASEELFKLVREILRRELAEDRTEEEVAELLVIAKPQAKAWLARLVEERMLEKIKKSKPTRYRSIATSDRLF
jgi:DNA processing protein